VSTRTSVDSVLGGYGEVLSGPLPPGIIGQPAQQHQCFHIVTKNALATSTLRPLDLQMPDVLIFLKVAECIEFDLWLDQEKTNAFR